MPVTVMIFLISAILTIGYLIYLSITSKHREKMAIIEKGEDFKYPENISKYPSLKWGLVLLTLGVALALGILADISSNNDGPFFTIPSVVVGAGLGQLLYFFIVNKMNKSDSDY